MSFQIEVYIKTIVKVSGCLGGFVAESMAMPVHWFYNPKEDIPKAFPPNGITGLKFEAPKLDEIHPLHKSYNKWMLIGEATPETGNKKIIGDVILQKHFTFWGPQQSHPHASLPAGGTTLNASCARLMFRHLAANKGAYNKSIWLDDYIKMMTDPKQEFYNDNYAEGYHVNFFKKLSAGTPKDQCGDAGEGTASIGGLTTQPALIVAELARDGNVARVQAVARDHLYTTAPHERMGVVTDALVVLINELWYKRDCSSDEDRAKGHVKSALAAALKAQDSSLDLDELLALGATDDSAVVGKKFSTSCDIANSWPCALFLVAKYFLAKDDDKSGEEENSALKAMVANANLGGENVHRGFIVGTLACMCAPTCDAIFDEDDGLFNSLVDAKIIMEEMQAAIVVDHSGGGSTEKKE